MFLFQRKVYPLKKLFGTYRFYSQFQTAPTRNLYYKKVVFGSFLLGLLGYDGIQNSFAYTGALERFARSSTLTISILTDYLWHLYGVNDTDEHYEELLKTINRRSSEKILKGCLTNGGLYIKVGQGVSHINHILPKEFLDPLKQLQNECLLRSPNEVDTVFEAEFGKKPTDMFKTFNYKAFAAASLAQVFEAETVDGEKVAVKVQYIDLQKRFNSDLGTILMLSNFVSLFFKDYKFGWILKELRENLLFELDFLHEGRNLERCKRDLTKYDFVYIPKVHWNLSSKKVLTCEYIDGIKIGDVEKIKNEKLDLADIDSKLFEIFAEQIFHTGFVHADPHEGNIFVRKNKKGKAEIVLIDHGLYETLPEEIRNNLGHFWKAIVLDDHQKMALYSKKLNVDDYNTFAEVLMQRPLDLKGARFSTKLTEEELKYLTQAAKSNFNKVIRTLQQLPRNMLFIIRNLNTVRSIAREHGDPVDRSKVMARHALKYIDQNSRGMGDFFSRLTVRIYFEYKLWVMATKFWILTSYLRVLRKLGRSPDTSHLFDVDYNV